MNNLDQRIQALLKQASDLPEHIDEPSVADEIISTFKGRRSWLLKWAAVKMIAAVVFMLFFAYQFFQQDSVMAMIAFATGTLLCAFAYASVFLFVWIQMNHNNTVSEIKRLELQLAILSRKLDQ